MAYTGLLIEESLASKECLKLLRITSTSVEPVTPRHRTPWVEQWTMHQFAIDDEASADNVALSIQQSLDGEHAAAWYVDFLSEARHVIVFKGRIFSIERGDSAQYEAVAAFGQELGIPATQLDFEPMR